MTQSDNHGRRYSSVPRLTPATVSSLMQNLWLSSVLRRETGFGCVDVEGRYLENASSKAYADGYYDFLEQTDSNSEETRQRLTIIVPSSLRSGLENGALCVLSGVLDVKPGGSPSTWKAVLRVSSVLKEGRPAPTFAESEKLRRRDGVLAKRAARETRDVAGMIFRRVVEGRPVRGGFVYGITGIVKEDVLNGMGNLAKLHPMNLTEVRVSMNSGASLASVLKREAAGKDFVALVRGGGEGVDVFDSLDLAEAVLECDCAVLCAIGHKSDSPFVERVADRAFATPTELGVELLRMTERAVARRDAETEALRICAETRMNEELEMWRGRVSELENRLAEMTSERGSAVLSVAAEMNRMRDSFEKRAEELEKRGAAEKERADRLEGELARAGESAEARVKDVERRVREECAEARRRFLLKTLGACVIGLALGGAAVYVLL